MQTNQGNKRGIHFKVDNEMYEEWRKQLKKRCMQQTLILSKWIEDQLEEWRNEEGKQE